MNMHFCSVWVLFARAACVYIETVRSSGLWILAAVLWQEWAYHLQWLHVCGGLCWIMLCGVVHILLWTQALCSAVHHQGFLRAQTVSAQRMILQYMRIIIVCMFYFFMFYGTSYLGHAAMMYLHNTHISPDISALTQFIVLQVPSLMILFFSALTLPALIIHFVSIWDAFWYSVRYVLSGGIHHIMFVCFLSAIPVYVQLPNTHHSMWLVAHHLKIICDVCTFLICAPLVFGSLIWMLAVQKTNHSPLNPCNN